MGFHPEAASPLFKFCAIFTRFCSAVNIYVRKAHRTRAHVFIIMLGYLLVHELQKVWRSIELTVEEGIAELASICSIEILVKAHTGYQTIPRPRAMGELLLKKLDVTLPDVIPFRNVVVVTKKKLVSERK